MEQQEIQTLINRCVDYLSARGYTPNRIKEIQRLWTSGIVKFMNNSGKSVYTSDVGELFVQELITSEPTRPVLKEKLLSIRLLYENRRNHPKPTVLYVPQYVANFVSKKSCSI